MGSNCCLSRLSQKKSWLAGLSACAKIQPVPGHQWNGSSGERRTFFIWIPRSHSPLCEFTSNSFRKHANCWTLTTAYTAKHCCMSCCDATFIHYFNHMICWHPIWETGHIFYTMFGALCGKVTQRCVHLYIHKKAMSHSLCSCHLSISLCSKNWGWR